MSKHPLYDSIELDKFILLPEYFDHRSDLHGINHTYRVMFNCLELGKATNLMSQAKFAFLAAFIHDMARKHDGYCTEHGTWAANSKLSLFLKLFHEEGAADSDISLISSAIVNHSQPKELPANDPAAVITFLLKDADALDRIRLGEDNLRSEFLRFRESHALIEPAKALFYKCPVKAIASFQELIAISGREEM